ncbi:MAG TPA: hypothetical protein VFT78_11415 [Hanamia sp.]|nr:hypothetical protein [Hanamia sp.]
MNIHFQDLIPKDFDDNSRVWVYQSSRLFSIQEALQLEEQLAEFSNVWKSHGSDVKAFANLFFGQFIVLMADESSVKVGGCSTDSAFRFIKNLEKVYHVQLLDRQTLAFIVNEKIQLIPLAHVNYSIEHDYITPDTLYFNNTILTKKELLNNWIIPVKDSWLAQRIPASHYEKDEKRKI